MERPRACARSRAFRWLIRRPCWRHAASRPPSRQGCGAGRGEGAFATHRPDGLLAGKPRPRWRTRTNRPVALASSLPSDHIRRWHSKASINAYLKRFRAGLASAEGLLLLKTATSTQEDWIEARR